MLVTAVTKRSVRAHLGPGDVTTAKVLGSFYCPHILGAFEGGWIGTTQLTHASLHLRDGFVFVIGHPLLHLTFYKTNVLWAFPEENRTHHSGAGSNHQHLDRILRVLDSSGRRQI